jgi:hypothetical protein
VILNTVVCVIEVLLLIALWRITRGRQDTLAERIEALADKGLRLRCGPHREGLLGFYAVFLTREEVWGSWYSAGHGYTMQEAIEIAIKIAGGEHVYVPSSSEFSC